MPNSTAALSRLTVADRGAATKPKGKSRKSKYITMRQATNIVEAVRFAKMIALPLVAHLTIHWSLTDVTDDPDGKLFAKVREGLDKWLDRHGVEFAGVWARERQAGDNPMSSIATCSFTCRRIIAGAKSCFRSRAPSLA
jgi:hypothetical protein